MAWLASGSASGVGPSTAHRDLLSKALSSLPHDCFNSLRHVGGWLVLPNADHEPPRRFKLHVSVFVSRLVPGDLLRPELRVRSMVTCPMDGAAVPITPIYEHCDPSGAEDDVGAPRKVSERPRINSIAQPNLMQSPPHLHLWLCVARRLQLHLPADRRARGKGSFERVGPGTALRQRFRLRARWCHPLSLAAIRCSVTPGRPETGTASSAKAASTDGPGGQLGLMWH